LFRSIKFLLISGLRHTGEKLGTADMLHTDLYLALVLPEEEAIGHDRICLLG